MLKGAGRKKSNVIHHRIFNQVHIAIAHNDDLQKLSGLWPVFNYFSIEGAICYVGFADVFGPMNLGSISQFCTLLDEEKDYLASIPATDRPARSAISPIPDQRRAPHGRLHDPEDGLRRRCSYHGQVRRATGVGRAVQGRHAGRGLFRLFQILIPSRPVSKHGGGKRSGGKHGVGKCCGDKCCGGKRGGGECGKRGGGECGGGKWGAGKCGGGECSGGKCGGAAAVSTRTALLRTARPAGIVRKVDSEVVRAAAAGFEPLWPILAGVAAGVMRDGGRGAVGGSESGSRDTGGAAGSTARVARVARATADSARSGGQGGWCWRRGRRGRCGCQGRHAGGRDVSGAGGFGCRNAGDADGAGGVGGVSGRRKEARAGGAGGAQAGGVGSQRRAARAVGGTGGRGAGSGIAAVATRARTTPAAWAAADGRRWLRAARAARAAGAVRYGWPAAAGRWRRRQGGVAGGPSAFCAGGLGGPGAGDAIGAGGKAAVATRDAGGTTPGACGASGVGSRVRRGRRAARVARAERAVVQRVVPLRAARSFHCLASLKHKSNSNALHIIDIVWTHCNRKK